MEEDITVLGTAGRVDGDRDLYLFKIFIFLLKYSLFTVLISAVQHITTTFKVIHSLTFSLIPSFDILKKIFPEIIVLRIRYEI